MNAKNAKPNRHWMFKHFMACDLDMDFLLTPDIEQKVSSQPQTKR